MNIQPPPPPINVLATALNVLHVYVNNFYVHVIIVRFIYRDKNCFVESKQERNIVAIASI